jgi:hypothetical protein
MTKKDALTIALSTLTASTYTNPSFDGKDTTRKEIPVEEVREVITKMIEQLSKPRKTSDEAKAKAKDKRAKARTALMEQVLPVIREGVADGGTAKEIYERCADALPADFTANKVQYILLNEMANEVVKTEAKGKPNVYKMKG